MTGPPPGSPVDGVSDSGGPNSPVVPIVPLENEVLMDQSNGGVQGAAEVGGEGTSQQPPAQAQQWGIKEESD